MKTYIIILLLGLISYQAIGSVKPPFIKQNQIIFNDEAPPVNSIAPIDTIEETPPDSMQSAPDDLELEPIDEPKDIPLDDLELPPTDEPKNIPPDDLELPPTDEPKNIPPDDLELPPTDEPKNIPPDDLELPPTDEPKNIPSDNLKLLLIDKAQETLPEKSELELQEEPQDTELNLLEKKEEIPSEQVTTLDFKVTNKNDPVKQLAELKRQKALAAAEAKLMARRKQIYASYQLIAAGTYYGKPSSPIYGASVSWSTSNARLMFQRGQVDIRDLPNSNAGPNDLPQEYWTVKYISYVLEDPWYNIYNGLGGIVYDAHVPDNANRWIGVAGLELFSLVTLEVGTSFTNGSSFMTVGFQFPVKNDKFEAGDTSLNMNSEIMKYSK